jgi:hypothetical protein
MQSFLLSLTASMLSALSQVMAKVYASEFTGKWKRPAHEQIITLHNGYMDCSGNGGEKH